MQLWEGIIIEEIKIGNILKLSVNHMKEMVSVKPQAVCSELEVNQVLSDLLNAVDMQSYVPQIPTSDNPALSDDYIFDTNDENLVLKDLTRENFVGKIKDIGKGATKRLERGLVQEYLYVFQYPCKLLRRDAQETGVDSEYVLIYIKINNRKTPYEKVFIISFHKNRINNRK